MFMSAKTVTPFMRNLYFQKYEKADMFHVGLFTLIQKKSPLQNLHQRPLFHIVLQFHSIQNSELFQPVRGNAI